MDFALASENCLCKLVRREELGLGEYVSLEDLRLTYSLFLLFPDPIVLFTTSNYNNFFKIIYINY